MKIIEIEIGKLLPYEKNAKKHPKEQVAKIAASIKRFGFQQPLVVDKDNVVIIGHGRLEAAKKLKYESVPCTIADNLSKDEINALRLADNKLNESEWDMEIVNMELEGLDEELKELTGFEPMEVLEAQEDDFDTTPPEEPKSKLGDLYQLGEHRLLCGDATKIEDVERLMGGENAELLFTSPPYSDMREYEGGKDLSVGNLVKFISTWKNSCVYQAVNLGMKITDGAVVPYWDEYTNEALTAGLKMLAWNVWKKNGVSVGQEKQFFPCYHEWIFVYGFETKEINRTQEKKTGETRKPEGTHRRQRDGSTKYSSQYSEDFVLSDKKRMESVFISNAELGAIRREHPATFPIELPSEYIKAMTNVGDCVAEPFGGSGSTLIACEQLKRKCRMMELDPRYIDVIIARWEKLTGQTAVLL